MPLHLWQWPLKPSTSVRTMPEEGRLRQYAEAIGAPLEEARAAFAADIPDVPHIPVRPAEDADDDPMTAQMQRLWGGLDSHHRATMVSMAKSLATLQRRTTAIEGNSMREVG